MKAITSQRRWARLGGGSFAALTLALLTACGGGSGGSDSGGDAQALAITTENADTLAMAGVAAVGVGSMASDLSVSLGGGTGVGRVVVQHSQRARALAVAAARKARPLGTFSQDCAVAGSITVSLVDLNADGELDGVGESVAIAADGCDEGGGTLLDGEFGMTVTSYTDGNNFSFNFTFADLVATDSAGVVSTADGDLAMTLSGGDTVTVSSTALAVSTDVSGTREAFALSEFSVRVVDRGDAIVESVSGVIAGSGLGNQWVRISTPVSVVVLNTDEQPSSGTMVFTGANSSALKIEAIDATQARLSVDANGDGSYETSKVVLWSELG